MNSRLPQLACGLLSCLLGIFAARAQAAAEPAAGIAPLFAGDTVLELALPVDFDKLCRPREDTECDFTPTTLEFTGPGGEHESISVAVKIRGGWRSLSRNCSVPLLWVRFDPMASAGTIFEGQVMLPLTTHCGKGVSLDNSRRHSRSHDYTQYLLREYLGQQLYRLLTDLSLRTRLLHISYPKPGERRYSAHHYAFFTEHFDALAARSGTTRLPRGSFDAQRLDAQAAGRLALFHFMLGNTDWSIARERNVMLLQTPQGRQIPVPYDLDMSGLVNADYAAPAPGLPIDEVRDRYFLGYCQPGTDWDELFAQFGGRREAMLAKPDSIPGFDRASRRWTRRFIDKFFGILESPEERTAAIIDACRPWPPTGVDHTSPAAERRH